MEMQEAAEALLERNAELEQQRRNLVRSTLQICSWSGLTSACGHEAPRPKQHADHESGPFHHISFQWSRPSLRNAPLPEEEMRRFKVRGLLSKMGTEWVVAQAAELKQLQAERAAQEPVSAQVPECHMHTDIAALFK